MTSTANATSHDDFAAHRGGRCGYRWRHHAHNSCDMPFPMKAAIVVGGLVLFPPLGLAALAYFALRHKFPGHADWTTWKAGHRPAEPVNSAFEARRKEVLDSIEAERQKLREEAKAFAAFADREKRARDQAEYDRFVSEKPKSDTPQDS